MKPKRRKKSRGEKVEMLIISKRLRVKGQWHVLATILSDREYTQEETETYTRLFLSMADKVPCGYCGYTYDYRRSMAVVYTGEMEEVILAVCSRCERNIDRTVRRVLREMMVGHD